MEAPVGTDMAAKCDFLKARTHSFLGSLIILHKVSSRFLAPLSSNWTHCSLLKFTLFPSPLCSGSPVALH